MARKARVVKVERESTGDRVVVLARDDDKEEAVGVADHGAERLDGRREAAVDLEVGVEQRQLGDVDVVELQPRDGVLADLRGYTRAQRSAATQP